MKQAELFDRAATVPSPLCPYECGARRCAKQGRAVYGPEEDHGGCVNRFITCLTCHATGEESRRKETP